MAASYSSEDIKRLLDLFPARVLSDYWNGVSSMTKEETTEHISKNVSDNLVFDFAFEKLDCCKLYVLVLEHGISGPLPASMLNDPLQLSAGNQTGSVTLVKSDTNREDYLYIFGQVYNVWFESTAGHQKTRFLWPLRVRRYDDCFIVQMTKLSKAIKTYFPNKEVVTHRRNYTRNNLSTLVVDCLRQGGSSISHADLHRGIKTLWAQDVIDAFESQFKTSYSVAREVMDEDTLIKRDVPQLYKEVKNLPLYDASFQLLNPSNHGLSLEGFRVKPREGELEFPRFTNNAGEVDYVVEKVIDKN